MTNDLLPDEIYYDGADAWDCARHSNVTKYIRADLVSTPTKPAEVDLDAILTLQDFDYIIKGWLSSDTGNKIDGEIKRVRDYIMSSGHLATGNGGDAVAWQVYNELVKEWTTAYADKAKADQLVKDGYKVRPLYAALTGDCGGGDLVHTVYVVEDDFTHIFSTEKLAREFADTKECPCVISTYLIDNPERFYEAVQ